MLWSFATGHAGHDERARRVRRARPPKPRPLRPHLRRSDRGRAGARLGPRRRPRRALRPPAQLHGRRAALPAPADRRDRRGHRCRRTPSHPQPALRRRRLRAALARQAAPPTSTSSSRQASMWDDEATRSRPDRPPARDRRWLRRWRRGGRDPAAATTTTSTKTGEAALEDAVRQALRRNDRLSGYVLWMNRVPTWATQSTRGPALVTLRQSAADRRKRGVRVRTLANRLEISSIELDPSYTRATGGREEHPARAAYRGGKPSVGRSSSTSGRRGATPTRCVRPVRRLEGARPGLTRAALVVLVTVVVSLALATSAAAWRCEAAPRTRAAHRHGRPLLAAGRPDSGQHRRLDRARQGKPGRNREVGSTLPRRGVRGGTETSGADRPNPYPPLRCGLGVRPEPRAARPGQLLVPRARAGFARTRPARLRPATRSSARAHRPSIPRRSPPRSPIGCRCCPAGFRTSPQATGLTGARSRGSGSTRGRGSRSSRSRSRARPSPSRPSRPSSSGASATAPDSGRPRHPLPLRPAAGGRDRACLRDALPPR